MDARGEASARWLFLAANFYEKAHFVKGRRGGLSVAEPNGFCPSRYASIRTLGEPALWWLGALWDPSFRSNRRRCNLRIGLSAEGGPSSHGAVALC